MKRIALILAGGRSRRFGTDKLAACLGGVPLIHYVVRALVPLHDAVYIAGPPEKWRPLGLPVIPDREPFQGPLAVLAYLEESLTYEKILMVAGDMPFLSPCLIDTLWSAATGPIALFKDSDRPSPLPGIYDRLAAKCARKLLERKRRDLKALLEDRALSAAILPLPPSARALTNINTPADLQSLQLKKS